MKLTLNKKHFTTIADSARTYYKDLNKPVDLDNSEFISYCYLLAIQDILIKNEVSVSIDITWERKYSGSIDDTNS